MMMEQVFSEGKGQPIHPVKVELLPAVAIRDTGLVLLIVFLAFTGAC